MKIEEDSRGFRTLVHPGYPKGERCRMVGESSKIGEYEDAMENPGSSFLWLGENLHAGRMEVAALRDILTYWLRHKRLPQSVDAVTEILAGRDSEAGAKTPEINMPVIGRLTGGGQAVFVGDETGDSVS